MINILHLIWIVPVSMLAGAITVIDIACVVNSSNITKLLEREGYDNGKVV